MQVHQHFSEDADMETFKFEYHANESPLKIKSFHIKYTSF